MSDSARTTWKIAVTGSASVGKTSLVKLLSPALGLPCIDEEMRPYLERTRARLSQLPSSEVAAILTGLWRERAEREASTEAFVADNCSLDFIAYALHYGCLTEKMASFLVPEVLKMTARYDAVFVLPWGVLPYVDDGVRSPGRYSQLGYQLMIEGLLRRHVDPAKVHYLPEGLNDLPARSRWACSVLEQNSAKDKRRAVPGLLLG
jgi:nicotinamide riboside kinase